MWWHHDWTGWNWFFMVVSMVLFWAIVIGGIVWAVRAASSSPPTKGRPTARDLLDERFARGEISEEEYRRSRDTMAER